MTFCPIRFNQNETSHFISPLQFVYNCNAINNINRWFQLSVKLNILHDKHIFLLYVFEIKKKKLYALVYYFSVYHFQHFGIEQKF